MISVKLDDSIQNLESLRTLLFITGAAQTCYQAEMPHPTEPMNIEGSIFKTGHHTVLQHLHLTFDIDGISVGDITFGMHLANVFYNSSQRSGRFCFSMFSNPDVPGIMSYIKEYYDLDFHQKEVVEQYIGQALGVYQEFLKPATDEVAKVIRRDRPKASEKYIEQNAAKIAQEQLRCVIPVIFPTGNKYTINLSSLAAMYRSSWSPVLRSLAEMMVQEILSRVPELKFMFTDSNDEEYRIRIRMPMGNECLVLDKIEHSRLANSIPRFDNAVIPSPADMHPVDLLPFRPKYMINNVINIDSHVSLSIASMGQDQRHRTIRRGEPELTGKFYLPPIPAIIGAKHKAEELMDLWAKLHWNHEIPNALAVTLAPYGAIVEYDKSASLNAFFHEQGKRGCWCAQQEIYEISSDLRNDLLKNVSKDDKKKLDEVLAAITPPCISKGVCGEGSRYCGRDMEVARNNPFPKRVI